MQPLTCDMWLIEPNAMRQFKTLAASDIRVSSQALEAVRSSRSESSKQKTVGIIQVHGVLEVRPTIFGEFFGMSSYEGIGLAFDTLMADESVKGIILDVMSPGGMAYGAPELANKIFRARGNGKPIISVVNPLAASGAFWIAAAADRIAMVPSGDTGSVGVYHEHISIARMVEEAGADVTITRSTESPFKAEMNDLEQLSPEAKQHIQDRVDEIYTQFVSDLARFRGFDANYISENFGKGRVVGAKQAMKVGMVDQVMTLAEVAMKLAAGRIRIASTRAEDDWNVPTVREQRQMEIAALKALAEPEEVTNG